MKALVFDFNGTISDDEPVLIRVYQELFEEVGRPITADEYLSELAGHTDPEMFTRWLGFADPDLMEERIRRYNALVADGSTVDEETRAAVRYAAERGPVGLVTSAYRAEVDPVLDVTGLRAAFTAVVVAGRRRRTASRIRSRTSARRSFSTSRRRARSCSRTRTSASTSAKAAGAYVVGSRARSAPDRHARGRRARRPGRRRPRRAAVLVIAHRGASAELPENTLPAFERAIEIGADYVEFDVWNGLEVTHAPPERGGSYPTLAEVIELCRGRIGLMVELKRPRGDTVERALRLLADDDVVVSFQRRAIEETRRLRPRLRTVQHVGFGVSIRRAQGGWAVGFPGPARHAPRDRGCAGARPRDDRLHGQRHVARCASCATWAYRASSRTSQVRLSRRCETGTRSPLADVRLALRRRPASAAERPRRNLRDDVRADRQSRRARGRHVGDQAAGHLHAA